jgi:peptide/nickel transport system substrate-binding protein
MQATRRNVLAGLASSVGAAALLSRTGIALAQGGTPVKGGVLRMWVNEPTTLTSAYTSAGQTYYTSGKIFDGLVEYDFDMKLKPKLATSWDLSQDGLTLSFKLRGDVKWHDGKPFTSSDLQYSALEIWRKLHPRGRSTWANLSAVDTPDATTAIFRFSKPSPYVLNALISPEAQVVPRHIYEGKDVLTNPANIAPIGNGPFKFKEWQRGDYILLERNEDYWDKGKPHLEQIVYRVIPDAAARSVAFEADEIDIGGGIPISLADARRLEKVPTLEIPERGAEAYGNNTFMEVNVRRPYLKNVRVRQAILHGLDRNFILKNIFFDFGKVATGPIPYTIGTFYTEDVPKYEYSLAKANALLDAAGHPRGADGTRFKVTIDVLPFGEYYFRLADYVKQQLTQLGVTAEIRNADFATYYRRIYTDYDFDITCSGASALTDPTIGVQRFFWSKNIIKGVPFSNGTGYSNPEVDALLEAAQTEIDPQKRTVLFHQFQKKVVEDLPILPMCDVPYFTVKNKAVKNTEISPFGISDNFADAYIES